MDNNKRFLDDVYDSEGSGRAHNPGLWNPRNDEWDRYLTDEKNHATRDEHPHMLCYGVFIASAQAALTDAVATLLRASIATTRDTADANDHLLNSANRTIATMHDATPTPLIFLEGELARFVESGAWEFGTCRKWVSRLFLVSKPACINQWRCIIDLRVLNFYCVRKRLKKSSYWECATSPRRESDYMFSFDLQDGFCALGIAEADRDYFTVDVRGQLYMFASLPMGWSLSPYYFVTLTQLIGRATRNAWWLPVRELQTLAEQAQYLFLAIPVARFFLLELHSVVGDRRGGRVRTTPQLSCDLQCWTSVPGQYNGKLIHLPVETAYLHTAMSFYGRFGPHSIDHVASALNTLLPSHNAAWLDPTCEAVDSLHLPDADWRREKKWCNSSTWAPVELVQKLHLMSGAAVTVVALRWEGKAWHQVLTDMVIEELTVAPRAGLFRPERREGRGMIGRPHWPVTIFRAPFRHGYTYAEGP
eukprot:jgi/Tetstr1/463459/TSEL_008352.t1